MKSKLIAILFPVLILITSHINGNPRFGYDFNDLSPKPYSTELGNCFVDMSHVITVYDGATFRCFLEGMPKIIGYAIDVSVWGVKPPNNKPKKNIKEVHIFSLKAKNFLREAIENAKVIELRHMRRSQKDFRILANVYIDGKELRGMIGRAGYDFNYKGLITNKYE